MHIITVYVCLMLILEVSSWGISDTLKYRSPFTAVNLGTTYRGEARGRLNITGGPWQE